MSSGFGKKPEYPEETHADTGRSANLCSTVLPGIQYQLQFAFIVCHATCFHCLFVFFPDISSALILSSYNIFRLQTSSKVQLSQTSWLMLIIISLPLALQFITFVVRGRTENIIIFNLFHNFSLLWHFCYTFQMLSCYLLDNSGKI